MTPLKVLIKKTAWREITPSILLVLNSFVWFILINEIFMLETEKLSLSTAYFVGIAASAIIGSKFFPRARVKFLYLWLLTGAAVTPFLITVPSNGMLANVLVTFFLGVSIGIGLPSCLSYFADSTHVENRSFIGGITWSGVGFTVLFFAVLMITLGLWAVIVALVIWRLFGGFSFLFLTTQNKKSVVQKSPSYSELVRKREILLYLFPWIMFSIINFAEMPILESPSVFGKAFAFVGLLEYAFIGIFAIVGGIIADFMGRKRVAITGFVMLGIEYAVLSLFYGSPGTLYVFMTLDGVTWGLFSSVFLMAIWGDLGENHEKEKYYVLGGLPFLLADFISILIGPYASGISPWLAFSFASFFLFLAVIPLMYAPETLPEKTIRDRELNHYIEQAKKAKEKYT